MASSSGAIGAAPAVDQAFQAPADHLHSLHATPDAHAMGSGRNIDLEDGSLIREPPPSSITPSKGALKQDGTAADQTAESYPSCPRNRNTSQMRTTSISTSLSRSSLRAATLWRTIHMWLRPLQQRKFRLACDSHNLKCFVAQLIHR